MELWQTIDRAPEEEARAALRAACGAPRWVERMLDRRPFGSRQALLATARDIWFALSDADWREAFSHHPAIGDRAPLRATFPDTHHLSEREQSGVTGATQDVLAALADANHQYADRFGYIFIVCATGKSAAEMLTSLRRRLENDPATEIRVAADEQAKITEIRLDR